MAEEKKEKTQKEKNFERMLFAIAVLYANQLGVNIKKQTSYDDLTDAQKAYANKVLKNNPTIEKRIDTDKRISEQQIVDDVANIQQENNSDLVKIVTVGDTTTCEKCNKWHNKIVSISGKNKNYPSLDDAVKAGFLHKNCRCALLDIKTDEIPLKQKINPRYESRKQARTDIYNHQPTFNLIFF